MCLRLSITAPFELWMEYLCNLPDLIMEVR